MISTILRLRAVKARIGLFSPDRTIALRAARLVGQPARPALRHPMRLLRMIRSDASSLRA